MAQQKIEKTKEARDAELAEIESLRSEIEKLCNKVPRRVLVGSYQAAVAWKGLAISSMRLAQSKAPSLTKLRLSQSSVTHVQQCFAPRWSDDGR